MLEGCHEILRVNRAPRTSDALMNKLTQRRAASHPQNCKPPRPFVSGCGVTNKGSAVPVGMIDALPKVGRDGALESCLCYDCVVPMAAVAVSR